MSRLLNSLFKNSQEIVFFNIFLVLEVIIAHEE
jgi:hypothetical protein